jgi:hypothetical protein
MPLPNIFDAQVSDALVARINQLAPTSQPLWGKMHVAQMLAHCNVSYEYVYEPDKYKKPPGLLRFILQLFVKNAVVNEKPYKHNLGTAPDFKVSPDKDFDREKERLVSFIRRTQAMGQAHFEGKESNSFGKLSAAEWNNLFYKHLDHHLRQFGA